MTDSTTPQKKDGFPLRAVIAGILAVLAIIVIAQNSQSVTIQLFVWSLTLPLWLVLAVFFVLGMLLNGLVRGGVRRLMGKPKKDDD